MTQSEMRFELLKLAHRPGMDPCRVIEQVREYETFLNESQEAQSPVGKKAPTGKKSGEPSK